MGSQTYSRETADNEEPDYYDKDIENNENKADISEYLDQNGNLKDEAYQLIDGSFEFKNHPNKTGTSRFEINNPLTEYIVGKILRDDMAFLDSTKPQLAPFGKLINLVNAKVPFISSIARHYLDEIKYLNPPKKYNQVLKKGRRKKGNNGPQYINGELLEIKNPNTKRFIKIDKPAYKKLYGQIKLKKVDYKKLSTYDQLDYVINNNCAIDFLTIHEKFDVEQLSIILNRKINDDIETDELIKIYEYFKIGIKIYDCMHNVYFKSEYPIDRIFKIYGDHLYVLKHDVITMKHTKRIINDVKDIDKYKNNKLIVTNAELWKSIIDYIKQNYIMIEYTDYQIPYKTNLIIFDSYYEIDNILLKDNDSKCRTVYNMIENELELTGYLNLETMNYFMENTKIRFQRTDKENDLLIDLNSAYPAQLIKAGIVYGIPNINDYWKVYDNKTYVKHGFYYCTLNDYDDILGLCDDIYTYYEVEIFKSDKRLKQITHMFIPSGQTIMTDDKINYIKSINKDRIRAYVGWLLKRESYNIIKYDIYDNNDLDIEASQNYYGEELCKNKNNVSINKIFLKKKTGILANILIKGLTNIDLYEMNKKMIKLNPLAKLNTIKTDSLGYVGNDIKKPEELFKEGAGFWKVENKVTKKHLLHNHKYIKGTNKPIIEPTNVNEYKEEDLINLLESDKSFIICGDYGTGKTYSIHDKIIPTLIKNNKKYLITSLTINNAERINGVTAGSIFNNLSNYEIKCKFDDIDYLIIDEAPLITQDILIYLNYVKKYCKTKFILTGDEKQTKGDGFIKDWDYSLFLLKLADCNKLHMLTNHRCDDKTIQLLDNIKNSRESWSNILKYILNNFQTTNDINSCKIHLCKHLKTKDKINSMEGMKCETIVTNQGVTINEKYMIHDIKYIPKDQMITAISRATKWEYIYLKI